MSILPPGEQIIETKKCKISGQEFFVTDKDLKFYDKISPIFGGKKYAIPSPTLCPDERTRRRFSHRNERYLYNRKCELTGKQILSNFGHHFQRHVYDVSTWFSDDWSSFDYQKSIDFGKPFFEQFEILSKEIPQISLAIVNCENSNYCNYVGNVKDSYLIFGSVYCEKCFFGSPYYCSHCLDSLVVRKSERSYECIDCTELADSSFCQDCHTSHDLHLCVDCKGCTNCIGCVGLRNAHYCIFNEQFSQTKYQDNLLQKKFSWNMRGIRKMKEVYLERPHKALQGENNENVIGNYLFNCKNSSINFYTDRCEDTRFCQQGVDLKNCYDNNYTEENTWCYEYLGNYRNHTCSFSRMCHEVSTSFYCNSCFNSQNLFGCDGIKHGHHCILNKPYSVQEYEILCGKIIDHMVSTGEWGEFFPHELSPFGYNETVAQEYFPLTELEVKKHGWNWKGEEETSSYHGAYYTPLSIDQYDEKIVGYEIAKKNIDELLNGILRCEITKKPFKVIRQELAFYIENHIPIPTKHPDQRHKERMSLRNPRKLFERKCAECGTNMITTYVPERTEKVVCEACYRKLVY